MYGLCICVCDLFMVLLIILLHNHMDLDHEKVISQNASLHFFIIEIMFQEVHFSTKKTSTLFGIDSFWTFITV